MANFASLIQQINSAVYTNGANLISGQALQTVLDAMVVSLGANYQYKGIATPSTNPGSPDERVFYIATAPGTYTNFGGLVVNDGEVAILKWDTSWHKDTTGIASLEKVNQLGQEVEFLDAAIVNGNIAPISIESSVYLKSDGSVEPLQYESVVVYTYRVLGENPYKVSGRVGTFGNGCLVAFYDENKTFINGSSAYPEGETGISYIDVPAIAPSGASFMKVCGNTSVIAPIAKFINPWTTQVSKIASNILKQVQADAVYTYNSISFKSNLYYQKEEGGAAVFAETNGETFTLQSTQRLVLHTADNTVSVVNTSSEITETDIVLLGLNSAGTFAFGALYPSYISSLCGLKKETHLLSFEYGSIKSGNGEISNYAWGGYKYKRTPKYIDVATLPFTINSSENVVLRIFKYAEDFSFQEMILVSLSANIDNTFYFPATRYLKFLISKVTDDIPSVNIEDFPITITSNAIKEVFNPIPSDSGYINFRYPINLANAASGDNDSTTVQDNENIGYDYGLLALPPTYKNIGKPTRLIIYCHGAGAGINGNTIRFNSSNMLRPEYWLAQGYAILDVDGNPFDKDMPHWYIPQAYQSYMNAYQWVIRNFNIAKDGIFLGGRSMGGAMAIGIINNTNIPIKSVFLIAPNGNFSTFLNIVGSVRHSTNPRKFIADKYGCIGTQPEWTLSNPMTQGEWDYFKSNYYRLCRYMPFWGLITNLPDVEEMMDDNFRVSATAARPVGELDLYESLKAKTRIPIKIFWAQDDNQAIPSRNAQYLLMELQQGGNICEARTVPTGGHFSEMNATNQVSVTLKNGDTMNNVPIFYIEALQFCRRYEENMW